MNDLNIVGGTVVRGERCFEGSVGVKDGRIVSVCPRGAPLDSARETMDASGTLIMPGMIDTHVHIRGGALSAREDFATGTMAERA